VLCNETVHRDHQTKDFHHLLSELAMDPQLSVAMEPVQESTTMPGITSHDSSSSLDVGNNEENDKSIAKGGVTTP
jgi:hypothetical protein